jgi:hypothetical protein
LNALLDVSKQSTAHKTLSNLSDSSQNKTRRHKFRAPPEIVEGPELGHSYDFDLENDEYCESSESEDELIGNQENIDPLMIGGDIYSEIKAKLHQSHEEEPSPIRDADYR